eukprot:382028-Pleurochrysis_carterae.AAC.1
MLSRQDAWLYLLMLIQWSLLHLSRRRCGLARQGARYDTFWERGRELPPFKVDTHSAVDFLLVVLDSPVGTVVEHSLSVVTETVAVQIYKLLTSQQLERVNARESGHPAMLAVFMALAHFSGLH